MPIPGKFVFFIMPMQFGRLLLKGFGLQRQKIKSYLFNKKI